MDRIRPEPTVGRVATIGRRVAIAGIGTSAALATLNLAVGVIAHSTSVVATGVEFAGDVLASTVVLIGMTVAIRPPDAEHPYGHGRVETLAALLIGIIVAAGGVGICWNALQAVGDAHPPPSSAAIVVLVVAIALRALMSVIKFRIGRRLRSASLVADAWNDSVDILGAATALTAVALTRHDPRFLAADHYGGFAVGIIVVATGLRVLRNASLDLMDTMPDAAAMEHLRVTALGVPGVLGVDKCYARKTGFGYHVDLHIEVDPSLTVAASHVVGGRVRSRIREHLDWVIDVLVHVEPAPGDRNDPSAQKPTAR